MTPPSSSSRRSCSELGAGGLSGASSACSAWSPSSKCRAASALRRWPTLRLHRHKQRREAHACACRRRDCQAAQAGAQTPSCCTTAPCCSFSPVTALTPYAECRQRHRLADALQGFWYAGSPHLRGYCRAKPMSNGSGDFAWRASTNSSASAPASPPTAAVSQRTVTSWCCPASQPVHGRDAQRARCSQGASSPHASSSRDSAIKMCSA